MKKVMQALLGFLCMGVVLATAAPAGSSDKVVEFDSMVGVSGPFLGTVNPVRGVPGGGLPWVLDRGEGELEADGKLEVEVQGLVLADDPSVPPGLRLTNPVPNFRAIVSCMIIDGAGNPAVVNVGTDNFPASPAGDSEIEAQLDLPTPCFAPIIFVTSPGGSWFAVTGR